MKRLFILMIAMTLVMPSFAQFGSHRKKKDRFNHNNTEQYYGLRLGLNISSIGSSAADLDTDSRSGLAIGAIYGLQLANSTPLWLETGLFYAEKGGKQKILDDKITYRLTYLQAPVVIKYAFDVADDLYIQPFLGGYLAMGIAGKTKEYQSRKSYSSYDNFSRFDGGLRLGCGVEYQMIYAELGFDFGLANISKDDFDTARNRNFFINVGVNF